MIFNYFLLLRYTTFILFNPQQIPVGSVYGRSTYHGDVQQVYDIRPINKKQFISSEKIDYLSLNNKFPDFQIEDFNPGNLPPYKVEMIYEDTLIREREKRDDNIVIENIFYNSGDFCMSVFNKTINKSKRFFYIKISYLHNWKGFYKNKRLFDTDYDNIREGNIETIISENMNKVCDIRVNRNGEKLIHEYISPWTKKQYLKEREYKSIKDDDYIEEPESESSESEDEEREENNERNLENDEEISVTQVLNHDDI